MTLPRGKRTTTIEGLERQAQAFQENRIATQRQPRGKALVSRTTRLVKTVPDTGDTPNYPDAAGNTFKFVFLDQTFPLEVGEQTPRFNELSGQYMDIGHSVKGYIPEGKTCLATWHPTSEDGDSLLALQQGGLLEQQAGGNIILQQGVPGGEWWLQPFPRDNWVIHIKDDPITGRTGTIPNFTPGTGTVDVLWLDPDSDQMAVVSEDVTIRSWVETDSETQKIGRAHEDPAGVLWFDGVEC